MHPHVEALPVRAGSAEVNSKVMTVFFELIDELDSTGPVFVRSAYEAFWFIYGVGFPRL